MPDHGAALSDVEVSRTMVPWPRNARGLQSPHHNRVNLLICDEPTASLDARSEHALFQTVLNHAAGRTILLITHRLANVRRADAAYTC
jgi:ABC-type transport system involved in cytochrome bd biosynthesis fused ATPase/permease subunit